MKRVSMADVAQHCGVSEMTVSRVVNGVQCVREETRKRVEASVAALGYKPDPVLRMLRAAYDLRSFADKATQDRATLAYLDFDCDDFSLDLFEKACVAAADLGYELKYFKSPAAKREKPKLSHRLWMQGIRGLIFGPAQGERNMGDFQSERFAMVNIGAFHHSLPIDTVGHDYFQNLYLAATQCHAQGARRIALCINPEREAYTGHRWVGAYHAFCREYKVQPILNDFPVGASKERRVVSWVRREKVDALIGLQGIRLFQHKLPEIFFACLNDWQTPMTRERLPTSDVGHIHVPRELIAKEAISLLDYNLLHRRYGIPSWPKHIGIEGKWRTSLLSEG